MTDTGSSDGMWRNEPPVHHLDFKVAEFHPRSIRRRKPSKSESRIPGEFCGWFFMGE